MIYWYEKFWCKRWIHILQYTGWWGALYREYTVITLNNFPINQEARFFPPFYILWKIIRKYLYFLIKDDTFLFTQSVFPQCDVRSFWMEKHFASIQYYFVAVVPFHLWSRAWRTELSFVVIRNKPNLFIPFMFYACIRGYNMPFVQKKYSGNKSLSPLRPECTRTFVLIWTKVTS